MDARGRTSWARRLFSHALGLFPPDFRARYGEEMQAAFDHEWTRRIGAGRVRRILWVIATLADTVVSGTGQRIAGGPGRGRPGRATFDAALQALGFTLRSARRAPGFTLAVVATLGLGIGATTMMYGITDRLLLRPPAHVADPGRVVRVYFDRTSPFLRTREISADFSYPDMVDLETLGGFGAVAGYSNTTYTLGWGTEAERLHVQMAGGAIFGLLGVQPELGRFYDAEEDGIPGTQVAVLSDEFWTRRFGRDRGILGRELRIGPGTYTVVGVAPRGFTGASIDPVDAWLPLLTTRAASSRSDAWRTSRNSYWFEVVARLRDGHDPEAVEAEATAAHRAGREDQIAAGRYDPDARVILGSIVPGRSPNAGSAVAVSRLLAGVALLVMLIACANVANLLFLRGVRRRREMAIRVVLGIPRRRLFLHLLLESLTLAAVAGVASILAARWGGALVYRTLLPELDPGPSLGYPHLLGFAGLVACISALLAGLAPAALASRPDLHRDLGGSGRGRSSSRMRSSLLVLQVAISVVLLAGAGLFLRSLDRVHDLDLGFVPDGVVVGNVETARGYVGDVSARAVTEAMARLRTEPGIEAVAVSSLTPFEGLYWGLAVQQADGESISLPSRPISYVISPDYFRVMGMRLLRGRGFTPADAVPGAPPVLVLSEGLASRAFGPADPLGRCLLVEQRDSGRPPCSRVVGILADHRAADLVEDASLIFYLPVGHPAAQDVSSVVARGSGGTPATLAAVRTALLDAGSDIRYASVRPLVDQVGALGRSWRLGATLFALFGGLALLVAGLGLHAIVSFEMAQRRREMGIRSALGAERGRLVAMVFRFAVLRALGGAVLGLTVVMALAGAARDLFFRTSPSDPVVLAASCLTLVAVAAAAALYPAASAARMPPSEALRSEG